MDGLGKSSHIPHNPEAEELTPEERVRSHHRFARQGEFTVGGYWVALRAHPSHAYVYGTTLEEVWNKALVHLITARLKK